MVTNLRCINGRATCRCGFSVPCAEQVGHVCASRRGLGDMVAGWLSAVGITPERVAAFTGKPCKCKQRQRRLNAIGRWLGIG